MDVESAATYVRTRYTVETQTGALWEPDRMAVKALFADQRTDGGCSFLAPNYSSLDACFA